MFWRELGSGRHPGDWVAAAFSSHERRIWMEVLSDLLRKSAEVTSAICNWVGDQVNRAGSGWIWPNAFRHRAGWRPIMGQWNPNPRRRADMKFGRITPVVKFWYGKFYRGHTKDIIDVDLFWRSTVKEKDSELLGYKFRYKEGIKSKISLGSQISSAGFNLGFGHLALVLKVMAAAEGGGDQGTINAIVAHPKPSGASSLPPGSRLESELQAVLVLNQSVDGIHDQATGSRVLPSSGNHDDKECEKRLTNENEPLVFSAELRCSPLKPFERKVGKVKAVHSQGVQRKLSFRGPGSVSSSSAGIRQDAKRYEDQPTRVDAFDGFDIREGKGEDSIDSQLADQTNMLHVSEVSSLGQKKGKDLVSKETSSIPSMEMIPAIRDLNVQQVSFGDGSTEEFGSPTKRKALPTTKSSGIVQQAVLEYGQRGAEETASSTRAMKRLKKGVEANTGVEDMEATSPGAAGKLAGPMRGSRQEK
ncbi:hypothetical protein OsJ_35278 [Oryza sativa Japonica Group]|uniref:Uncharacterized protein n=1 Tax=Oryza sativa subsp. japonica TaxID=39947 RepID=B9GBZ0_ORYSJ|nr:hypothetical protein OsJ_35278 [Oryza sativa Japonica Group]